MRTVFIISAPSGSGKSTLVTKLLETMGGLHFSVSYTTRKPRGQEKNGESYFFIDRDEFERRIQAGEFLEWAQVFGNYYGTHRSEMDRAFAAGKDLLLDIDVQGARQLRKTLSPSVAVSIFVLAPSRQELEQRLRARGEDAESVIERRLRDAAKEIGNYGQYDYVLVNREVEDSVETLRSVVRAERVRRERMENEIRPILESFEQDSSKRGL
jgi:guanylate kinase